MKSAVFFFVPFLLLVSPALAHGEFAFETASLSELDDELIEWFPPTAPGLFYPFQRLAEEIQMFFTFDRLEKAAYSTTLAQRRFGEALAQRDGLDGFLAEARRLRDHLILAEQKGVAGPVAEKSWNVLFGAAVRLDLYETSLNRNTSLEKEATLAILADIVAAQNRTEPSAELQRLEEKLKTVVENSKLASMSVLESQLVAHLKEYQNVLLEANNQLGGQKLSVAARRSDDLGGELSTIERFVDEGDGKKVQEGLTFLKGLWLEAGQLKKSSLAKARGLEWCVQVNASSRNPATGECRDFPTPCEVPEGWEIGACV